MHQISKSEGAEIYQQVLALTAILYRPITVPELVTLVEQLKDLVDDLGSVQEIVSLYRSFLTLREDTAYFMHQSTKDFLFTKAFHKVFPDRTEAAHQVIFSRSLAILSRTLHRDIYSLEALGFLINNVQPPKPDPLVASQYPCVYYINHLYHSKHKSQANGVSNLQIIVVINEF